MLTSEEITTFEMVKDAFEAEDKQIITKSKLLIMRDAYSRETGDKISNCMCTQVQRMIFGTKFLEWYETEY